MTDEAFAAVILRDVDERGERSMTFADQLQAQGVQRRFVDFIRQRALTWTRYSGEKPEDYDRSITPVAYPDGSTHWTLRIVRSRQP